jgi:hypothetical protein
MKRRTGPRSRISELKQLYGRLSHTARAGLWALLALEAVLVTAAEYDIHRRPAGEIRGPKLLWRALATQNVIGPAAYFGLGIRRSR